MVDEKIYISQIPKLMDEWNWNKNNKIGLYPNKLLLYSNKKAWWKCKNNHEFAEVISKRTKGKPCPYCANKRVLIGFNDLKTLYPDLAKEWDYDKNTFIDINSVVKGSNKKAWWKCSVCGHEWLTSISARTVRGTGCPLCAIKKGSSVRSKAILKNKGGLNLPLLLQEWDYEANGNLLPENVTNGSSKYAYWKCSKCGYKWRAKILNRAIGGRGCPCCANAVVVPGINDLATTHPELIKEWDYEKNIDITPQKVTHGTRKKVYWICPKGHSYQASVLHRSHGTNCPICNAGRQTSFAEQAFFFYIKKIYPDAINRYTDIFDNGMELDIYIPSIKTAIEYDGIFWHKNKRNREEKKYRICQKNGIKLIRIKESGDMNYEGIADAVFHAANLDKKRVLNGLIINFIRELKRSSLFEGVMLPIISVDVIRDEFEIRKYMKELKTGSLEELRPDLAREWCFEKNGDLLPSMFSLGSDQKVWWKCSICGHIWRASIGHRVNGTGCNVCYRKNNKGKNHGGSKRIYQYSAEGDFIKEWDCIANAGKELQINRSNISMCAYHQRYKAGGYRWEFFCKEKLEPVIKIKKNLKGICRKRIVQIDDNGNEINEFISLKEAARQLNIDATSISKALHGHIKRAGGFYWKEKDKPE